MPLTLARFELKSNNFHNHSSNIGDQSLILCLKALSLKLAADLAQLQDHKMSLDDSVSTMWDWVGALGVGLRVEFIFYLPAQPLLFSHTTPANGPHSTAAAHEERITDSAGLPF